MKIVPKLTVTIVAGMCVVLAINGWFRVRRETATFEAERMKRHVLVGRAIGAAVRASWRTDGEDAALATLSSAVSRYAALEARFLADGSAEPRHADAAVLQQATEPLTTIDRMQDPPVWFTYVPIVVGGRRHGEIELIEPATVDVENRREVVLETVKTAAVLALLSALVAFFLGELLVGKPIRTLREEARRIGRGDLDGAVGLRSRDELAELGTEMDVMRRRLRSTLAQLRHTDRLATVGRLASGVAHELGTPLNVVSARAEMLLGAEAADSERRRRYAGAIIDASNRMTRIIQSLLRFARREDLRRAPVGPDILVNDSVELLRPLAKKRTIAIDVVTTGAEPVSADSGQLQQVVTNLVINALHASPDGARVVVRVDEGLETAPPDAGGRAMRAARIAVEDHGSGITPEHLPRVFEPFFTTKEVGEGTGLGLAVAYGIVRDHGGWITVDSHLGAGTTFVVHLPYEEAGVE